MTTIPDHSLSQPTQELILEQILRGAEGDIVLAEPGQELVRITAYTARQKVSAHVALEISTMMGGSTPALVWSGGRLVWRVPIVFTSPRIGHIGYVGVIDVDARSGCLLIPKNLQAEVESHAAALVERTAHPTAG